MPARFDQSNVVQDLESWNRENDESFHALLGSPSPETRGRPAIDESPEDSRSFEGPPIAVHRDVAVERISRAVLSGKRLALAAKAGATVSVEAGRAPRGHFSVRVGPSFAGKTALEIWIAMADAAGVPPWDGASASEPRTTLIYSPDEPAAQVARRIATLAPAHPGGLSAEAYFDRIHVLGLDPSVDSDLLAGLYLTADGLTRWRNLLRERRPDRLVIDAYGDVLPPGATENDNDAARTIGGGLEAIAVETGTEITALHHVGKMPPGAKSSDLDVRDLGRGASALAQKARAVFSLEEVPGRNHQRLCRTRTNLGPTPAPMRLDVCEEGARAPEISHFRRHDPLAEYDPRSLTPESIWISTNDLARSLDRYANPERTREEPPGVFKTLAKDLRNAWAAEGRIDVRDGQRGAKEIRLRDGADA